MKLRKNAESKKAEKSLEISAFLVFSCLHLNQTRIMAGIAGLEPARAGVKVSMLQTCFASLPARTLRILAQNFAPARVRTISGCLPKQPLGRAEGNSARTASRAGSQSHLCCRLAEQVCLRERWAFSRRTLLLHAPIQVEQTLPKQPLGRAEGNTVRTASRAGSQSLSAADLRSKSAYENAGRSRAELCSCTRRYKLNKPCQNSPSDEPREIR